MSSFSKTDDLETRSLSAAFKEVSQRSLGISIPDVKQKNSILNPIKAAHLRTVSEKAALLGRSILHATFEAAISAGRSPPIKIVPNDHDRSECTRNLDSFERSLARYQHRSAIPPERGLTWSRDAPKLLEEIQSLIPGMPNPLLLTSEASKLYEKHHAISLKGKTGSTFTSGFTSNSRLSSSSSSSSLDQSTTAKSNTSSSSPIQLYTRISHLNLVSARISYMDQGLLSFESLHELNVSHNEIQEINNLPKSIKAVHACDNLISTIYWGPSTTPFFNLIHLALGSNTITSLGDLQLDYYTPRLIVLDVSFNNLISLESVLESISKLSRLAHLRLYGNPCALTLDYIDKVVHKLSNLHGLDDNATGEAERMTRHIRKKSGISTNTSLASSSSSSSSLNSLSTTGLNKSNVELHPLAQFPNDSLENSCIEKVRMSIQLEEVNQLTESSDVFSLLELVGLELPHERSTISSYCLSFTLEKVFTAMSATTSRHTSGNETLQSEKIVEKLHSDIKSSKSGTSSSGGGGGIKGKDIKEKGHHDESSIQHTSPIVHSLPILTWNGQDSTSTILIEMPPTIILRNALRYDNLKIKLFEKKLGETDEKLQCIAEGSVSLVGLLKPPQEPFIELEINHIRLDLKCLPNIAVDSIRYIKTLIENEEEKVKENARRLLEEAQAAAVQAADIQAAATATLPTGIGGGSGSVVGSRRPSAANVLSSSSSSSSSSTVGSRRSSMVLKENLGDIKKEDDTGNGNGIISDIILQKLSKYRPFTASRQKLVEEQVLKGLASMVLIVKMKVIFENEEEKGLGSGGEIKEVKWG